LATIQTESHLETLLLRTCFGRDHRGIGQLWEVIYKVCMTPQTDWSPLWRNLRHMANRRATTLALGNQAL